MGQKWRMQRQPLQDAVNPCMPYEYGVESQNIESAVTLPVVNSLSGGLCPPQQLTATAYCRSRRNSRNSQAQGVKRSSTPKGPYRAGSFPQIQWRISPWRREWDQQGPNLASETRPLQNLSPAIIWHSNLSQFWRAAMFQPVKSHLILNPSAATPPAHRCASRDQRREKN
jgi:hypothetical protein